MSPTLENLEAGIQFCLTADVPPRGLRVLLSFKNTDSALRVDEIARLSEMSSSQTYPMLQVLRRQGFILAERVGQRTKVFSLNPEKFK